MNTSKIARLAGVSAGTVSNVVNGKLTVGEEVRDRVLKVIREANWKPNELARGLRTPSTKLIVMFLPDITNPFFSSVVRGVEDAASRQKHRIVLCNTDNQPKKEADLFADMAGFNPAGYLLIPAAASYIVERLRESAKPAVFLDRSPDDWKGDFVTANNEDGARQVAKHLVDYGHRTISIITGPLTSQVARLRLNGFRAGLRDARLNLPEECIAEAMFDREAGMVAAKRLLGLLPRPTAIFASNDLIAAGVLLAIRQAGLTCPSDISVVGFDNQDFAELTAPGLTSVHQPAYQMGIRAVQQLFHRIAHPEAESGIIKLPVELRIRSSVQLRANQSTGKPSKRKKPSKRSG